MTKTFISYRRADSQFVTDNIYEHMVKHFGTENVFLDVGNIPFGVDFRQYLQEQIQSHDVVLVIIGPEWSKIMQERAEQANDFVRIEIENALKLDKLVIPVLVMGAQMPDFSPLPQSIQDLQWRNSATVRRQPDLAGDCRRLAEGIQQFFGKTMPVSDPMVSTGTAQALNENSPAKLGKSKVMNILPLPFEWINIPPGQVTLIPTNTDKREGYLRSKTVLDVPSFEISKYPITNAQYAKFIDAGGYKNKIWWTDKGWQIREEGWDFDFDLLEWKSTGIAWTQPRWWHDKQWNGKDQPVIGISWFEAIAFCRWLRDITGEYITLPTEQQWQRAAQGDTTRLYPWGKEWDCQRCNNSVKPCESNETTPVNAYSGKGDSPYGVSDMVGNVWEWCITAYKTGREREQGGVEVLRLMRGGSWYGDSVHYFSTTLRKADEPLICFDYIGFRCIRLLEIES